MRQSRKAKLKRAKSQRVERANSNLETRLRSIKEEGCDEDSNDDNSCSSSVFTQMIPNEKIKMDNSNRAFVGKTQGLATQRTAGNVDLNELVQKSLQNNQEINQALLLALQENKKLKLKNEELAQKNQKLLRLNLTLELTLLPQQQKNMGLLQQIIALTQRNISLEQAMENRTLSHAEYDQNIGAEAERNIEQIQGIDGPDAVRVDEEVSQNSSGVGPRRAEIDNLASDEQNSQAESAAMSLSSFSLGSMNLSDLNQDGGNLDHFERSIS